MNELLKSLIDQHNCCVSLLTMPGVISIDHRSVQVQESEMAVFNDITWKRTESEFYPWSASAIGPYNVEFTSVMTDGERQALEDGLLTPKLIDVARTALAIASLMLTREVLDISHRGIQVNKDIWLKVLAESECPASFSEVDSDGWYCNELVYQDVKIFTVGQA